MAELNELTEFVKNQAMELAKTEEHAPILFAITPDKGVGIAPVGDINKDKFQETISNGLRKVGASAYVLVNEAWVAKFQRDKDKLWSPWLEKLQRGELSVSELPPDDKIETLMITSVENGKSYVVWQAKIEYNTDGERVIGLWEKVIDVAKGVGELKGRLVLKSW